MTATDSIIERPEISVVIPCYNEEENVREIHAAVQRELLDHSRSHEIIFIDNDSTDRTRELLREIAAADPRTRLIFNSRNYGQMRSPTYGLYQAEGEAVIGMGADFQDPPALIPDVIRLWRAGAQVVFGQRRTEKASWLLTLARKSGYRFLGRYADYRVLPGVTGWGLFSREVIDTLAAWNEPEPFFRGMVVEGGFRISLIPFDRPERAAGETKNNLAALFDFALSGLAGSAKGLLRLPILLSLYIGLAVLLLLIVTLTSAVLDWSHTGFLLLLTVQGGMFAVLMLFLGLVGEQVRAISERTRNVPLVLEDETDKLPTRPAGTGVTDLRSTDPAADFVVRIAHRPAELLRRLPEIVLTVLVLAGLANLINRFHVDGRLPQPFVYDFSDTLMDWFNTAYWAHHPGAFDVWRTVYPPLSFAFLKVFGIAECYVSTPAHARDCDWIGIATILGCYLLSIILAAVAFYRAERGTALFRATSFAFGLPLLYTLERGNLILPCLIFFIIAFGKLARSSGLRAMAIAVTINFKPYLLLPALALLIKRRWRLLELAGVGSVFVYLLTLAIVGAGSPQQLFVNARDWVTITSGYAYELIYYSTSYMPFLVFDSYLFPTHEVLSEKSITPFFVAIPIIINVSRLLGLATLAGAWVQPGALSQNRLALILLTTSLVNQSPGGYTEAFVIFLLFLEKWERPGTMVALTAGYLLSAPYDSVITNIVTLTGDSWLAGRMVSAPFGVTLGMFIRPGLLVLMQWSLALDSILLIARAHRLHRPSFGLGRAAEPMLQPT